MPQPTTNIDHVEYPKGLRDKSIDSLHYIMRDAYQAMTAMPEGHKAGYYADEINYCADELKRRGITTGLSIRGVRMPMTAGEFTYLSNLTEATMLKQKDEISQLKHDLHNAQSQRDNTARLLGLAYAALHAIREASEPCPDGFEHHEVARLRRAIRAMTLPAKSTAPIERIIID